VTVGLQVDRYPSLPHTLSNFSQFSIVQFFGSGLQKELLEVYVHFGVTVGLQGDRYPSLHHTLSNFSQFSIVQFFGSGHQKELLEVYVHFEVLLVKSDVSAVVAKSMASK